MESVKIGVIGLGAMGRNHVRVATTIPDVDLVGGFDIDPQQAAAVCGAHNCQPFADAASLIERCDALILGLPSVHHFDLAQQCLAANKHLLIEKPVTATAQQGQQLANLAEQTDTVVQVGHVERFNPAYQELKRVLQREELLALSATRNSPFAERASDVSVTFDLLIHDLDLVFDLLDVTPEALKTLTLSAVGIAHKSEKLNHLECTLCPRGGPLVHLTASKITHEKIRSYHATCDRAFVVADLLTKAVNIFRHETSDYADEQGNVAYRQAGIVERVLVPTVEPLVAQMRDFIKAIRSTGRPQVGLAAGLLALEAAETIEKRALQTR